MSSDTLTANTNKEQSAAYSGSMQLVSFHLGEEVYGIEIVKVREIILMAQNAEAICSDENGIL